MQTRIDKSKITHIVVNKEKVLKSHTISLGLSTFKYMKSKTVSKLFGLYKKNYEEGYYTNDLSFFYHMNDLENDGLFDKDGILYKKIYIDVYVGDTLLYYKYFNSFNEAEDYCIKNIPNANFIV